MLAYGHTPFLYQREAAAAVAEAEHMWAEGEAETTIGCLRSEHDYWKAHYSAL